MKMITRTAVMSFWKFQIDNKVQTYQDSAGEIEYTLMGEDAADYFGVMSEFGNSDIEEAIFIWATESGNLFKNLKERPSSKRPDKIS